LSGKIYVNPDKLDALADKLRATVRMVGDLIEENEILIDRTSRKIQQALYAATNDVRVAQEALERSKRDLAAAQAEAAVRGGSVPRFYYEAVRECGANLDRAKAYLRKVMNASENFTAAVAKYKKASGDSSREYEDKAKRGGVFLKQYAEIVREADRILGPPGKMPTESSPAKPSVTNVYSNKLPVNTVVTRPPFPAPREMARTNQAWTLRSDGNRVFDAPEETGRMLDANQGKVEGFRGTCGLVSCENVLRMAGVDVDEKDIVDFASRYGFCVTKSDPKYNGNTNPWKIQKILNYFGLKNEIKDATLENISVAVTEGRGVIIGVDAGEFWNDNRYSGCGHAITVTSVQKDAAGNVTGFFVCDSGTQAGDNARFCLAETLGKSLLAGSPIVVTSVTR
jgi:hypothetical protein